MYRYGQAVTATLMTGTYGDDDREVTSIETAEVVGHDIERPGMVHIRPLAGQEVLTVHIGQLAG